jgi:hypothetical protein
LTLLFTFGFGELPLVVTCMSACGSQKVTSFTFSIDACAPTTLRARKEMAIEVVD